MSSPQFELLRRAIEKKQQVIATYKERRREFCPHAIGYNKKGEEALLAYQFGGESSQGPLAPPGSNKNWRVLDPPKLHDIQVRDGPWFSAPDYPGDLTKKHFDRITAMVPG